MANLDREALDPEIRAGVRDIPEFVFSAETVPMMRQNAVFTPVTAPAKTPSGPMMPEVRKPV